VVDGQPAAALARLLPLLDRTGLEEDEVTPLLPMVAWAHLELGEDSAAAAVALQAVRRARAQHHRLALVDALWVQALVAIRQGTAAVADHALATGLALARRMAYPYAEARLLRLGGTWAVEQRKPTQGQVRLTAALRIFQRLGAHPEAERAAQALAALS
jgi:hypothetical protein